MAQAPPPSSAPRRRMSPLRMLLLLLLGLVLLTFGLQQCGVDVLSTEESSEIDHQPHRDYVPE